MRNLISDLVPYWGLDQDQDAQPLEDFLQEFDRKIEAIIYDAAVPDDSLEVCNKTIEGLYLYGIEMSVAQGSDAMGAILDVSDLINEVADKFGYPTAEYRDIANQLLDEVRTLLMDYELPGQSIEGDNVKNYIVKQAILYDNDIGFALAHNPEAVSPYVTWQMTYDEGKLDYYWGKYYSLEENALVNYIERTTDYENIYAVKEKALPEPIVPELLEEKEEKKLIQFIDSEYRELFKIPDGESIRVTYPPEDGRTPAEASCKFLDETHTQIGGTVYHICQFAERMEALGAKYEPVNQLDIITVAPQTIEDSIFFKANREEGNTCVGIVHGSFGNSGEHYHADWNSWENGLYTPKVQSELQSVIYTLRHDMLKDKDSMSAYCKERPEARLPEYATVEAYGFKVETDARQYFVRCTLEQSNPQFIMFAYADKPTPSIMLVAEPPQATKEKTYTSVLKAIEDGKKAPKPPRKEKSKAQHKSKEEEL